jgi:prepilin-type N-terminal cleavage/methylation domain-containing protein
MAITRSGARRALALAGGFTLIELAIALLVIALLLGSMLVPLRTQVESRRIEETRRILEQAREALLGYASAHGRFPCPATASSFGGEPPNTNLDTGQCDTYRGYLPASLLGLSPLDAEGFALDAWGLAGNRIRYAIAPYTVGGVERPFTKSGGMAAAAIPALGAADTLFQVCASGDGATGTSDCGSPGNRLTSRAVFVIWSLGANATSGGGVASVHERINLDDNSRLFVSRVRSDVAGAEFDDILVWVSPALIVSRLVAAAQLP